MEQREDLVEEAGTRFIETWGRPLFNSLLLSADTTMMIIKYCKGSIFEIQCVKESNQESNNIIETTKAKAIF